MALKIVFTKTHMHIPFLKYTPLTGLSIRGGTRYFYLPKMVFGTS
jgi:hypothetical protein